MRIQLFSLVHQRIYFIIDGNICQLIFYTEQAYLERYPWLLLSFFVENIFSYNRRRTAPQKTSAATLKDCYALYQLNVLMSRGLTIYCFFWNFFVFRELNKTPLLVKAPSQIIMTAIHVTCSTLTRHKIMPIGGFDNLSAQFALDSILDNLSHTLISIANTISQRFRKVQAFECVLSRDFFKFPFLCLLRIKF